MIVEEANKEKWEYHEEHWKRASNWKGEKENNENQEKIQF